ESLPSSSSFNTDAHVSCLVIDPMAKAVSASTGAPFESDRLPYPFESTTSPLRTMATPRPGIFRSFTSPASHASIAATWKREGATGAADSDFDDEGDPCRCRQPASAASERVRPTKRAREDNVHLRRKTSQITIAMTSSATMATIAITFAFDVGCGAGAEGA